MPSRGAWATLQKIYLQFDRRSNHRSSICELPRGFTHRPPAKRNTVVMARSGVVKVAIALGVVVAIAYPIRHELMARAAIQHDLINSLDANDAAALRLWQGSAESFVAMLYDRC